MKKDGDQTYALSLTVRNRPGVLVRCAQVFGRRGHNIESLTVVPRKNHDDVSEISITAFGKPDVMHQIVLQLAKLVDVTDIKETEL